MNKILLIVNPHSGKKKGLQISNDVTNILKEKNLSYATIQTPHK